MSDTIDSTKQIQGKVARIINARELAINIGTENGVEENMEFAVLAATPLEIRDPDSKIVLDTIDREKVRVKVTSVKQKIAICKTYRSTHIPGGPLWMSMNVLGGADFARPPRDVPETLRAKDIDYPEPLSEEDSFVKVGDRVILVTE